MKSFQANISQPIVWLIALFVLSVAGQLFSWWRLDSPLTHEVTAYIEARILNTALTTSDQVRMDVLIRSANDHAIVKNTKVRLYCFQFCNTADWEKGNNFATVVSFSPPQIPHNPTHFDYNNWLWRKNFFATGIIRQTPEPIAPSPSIIQKLDIWREMLMQKYQHLSGAFSHQRTIMALISGKKQWLTPPQRETLINTGTMHLMVVSGLHMGLASLLCIFIALRLGTNSIVALVVGIFAMAGYFWLSGFGAPAQRALVMGIVSSIWIMCSRLLSPWWGIGIALTLTSFSYITFWQDAGIMLSFVAVMTILSCIASTNRMGRIKRLVWMQWALCIVLGVVQAMIFSRVSLVAMPTNLIVTPLVAFVVLPLILFGALMSAISSGITELLWRMADHLLGWIWQLLNWFNSIPIASIEIAGERMDNPLMFMSVLPLALIVLIPSGLPGSRILPILALLAIIWQPDTSQQQLAKTFREPITIDTLQLLASLNDLYTLVRYDDTALVIAAASGKNQDHCINHIQALALVK